MQENASQTQAKESATNKKKSYKESNISSQELCKQQEEIKKEFEQLLDSDQLEQSFKEGLVVQGEVVDVQNSHVILDIGLKSEGRVPLNEFEQMEEEVPKVGDTVDVYIEKLENKKSEVVVSRIKARKKAAWLTLEEKQKKGEKTEGMILGKIRGGFNVLIDGISAFLPVSHIDIRPIRDYQHLMQSPQEFIILKIDRQRNNIVVSRKAALEEKFSGRREELLQNLKEGDVVEGVVKNITNYGAFIDLGGVDGLLHVIDMSWKRVSSPYSMLNIADNVKVKVIKINPETKRISLGLKQLQDDPWHEAAKKYKVGDKQSGKIIKITNYGAFIELESGVEGLVHVSEMSWTDRNIQPEKILSTSQEIEVVVLGIDTEQRRMSLGMKQLQTNPWLEFVRSHKVGDVIKCEVEGTGFRGVKVRLENDLVSNIDKEELDWNLPPSEAVKKFYKNQEVEAIITKITEKDGHAYVNLSFKRLAPDPFDSLRDYSVGDIVTCTVENIDKSGIFVKIFDKIETYIKKSELSQDRSEQRTERFANGDKIDAKITRLDKESHKITVSVKALEILEEKQAIEKFGSRDSGASLGDILGVAIDTSKNKEKDHDEKKVKKETTAKSESSKKDNKESKENKKEAKKGSKESIEDKAGDKKSKEKSEEK